ncbi:MAG TPA: pyridoxamine 5'-phosphate oxidase [Actinomycetes bacterium]|jgi:pyridoxamine 5'-phosphate oxidase|nr:pyridoxamine 5'-phosphate oxidase [Actinomycetes bacterium]
MQPTDLANLRRSYLQSTLSEADLAPDPVSQFIVWFAEVRDAGIVEPNALVLGTAGSDARPTARTVLLKDVDERGFTVYTNYSSRKGHDIAANPWVSMLFPWHAVERQVIVTGRAERVSRAESAAYFVSRPYGSRIGALASPQSSVIGSRTELEERYAALAQRYPEGTDVPLPDDWGGVLIVPDAVEFWQGRPNRLHDRLRYVRDLPDAPWIVQRLAP